MFSHSLGPDSELRMLEPYHADELYELVDANRKHLRRWLPWVDETRRMEDIREFIKAMLFSHSNGKDMVVGIWYEGRVAGALGLHDVNPRLGSAEIGYWLGEDFQGKGLITRACRAVLDHAFSNLGLNRVQIRVEPENKRSRAVPKRLGFQFEGILRQSGIARGLRVDLEVYSILRSEWEQLG